MAKTRTYLKCFNSEDNADRHMRTINRASRDQTIFCVVDGPEDDFAVVDLVTAIDLEIPYRWAR